jgi:hypothetical protein
MAEINGSNKWALVSGLLTECPLGKPLADCPSKKVRGLPREERSRLVESMDESELALIISHHRYCFQKRRLERLHEEGSSYYSVPRGENYRPVVELAENFSHFSIQP